jgi:putative transcriptional regulator
MVMLFLPWRETGPVFSGRHSGSPVSPAFASSALPNRLFAYAGLSKGKFLVAGGNMADPRFSETVIFLVGHGPDGAMGLVINRPTKARLSEAFPDLDGLKKRTDTLLIGGPVRTDQLFMLIRASVKPEDSSHVVKDVYVSGSRALLKKMVDKGESAKRVRVFAGYAGWGAQQLEREVARGDWYVMEADAESIFEKEPSRVWPELFRRGSAKWVRAGAGIFCPPINTIL